MTPRAILFDLDGTLIDQFQAIHRAFSLTLEQMGFETPSFEKVKKAVGGASESTMTKIPHQSEPKRPLKYLGQFLKRKC